MVESMVMPSNTLWSLLQGFNLFGDEGEKGVMLFTSPLCQPLRNAGEVEELWRKGGFSGCLSFGMGKVLLLTTSLTEDGGLQFIFAL